MRKHYRFSLFIVVVILVSLLGVNLTFAQETGNSSPSNLIDTNADQPWTSQFVHQVSYPDDVGKYASLGLRPFDDLPYISYYDAANGNLMLAHWAPNTGNCGTNNNWQCEVLDGDNGDDVGSFSSLDFWADDATQTWKIGISYHDTTNGALKFITWSCTPQVCTLHKIYTIQAAPFDFVSHGLYTSLKFAIDGTPIIAYYMAYSLGDDLLYYVYYRESAGNCGESPDEGEWQCDIIDAGEGVGQYVSLDLTYDGTPYLAYYDADNGNLKLANYWGLTDFDCYENNGWECPIIDAVGAVGSYASLVMQRFSTDKLYRIAYYDASTDTLKYTDQDLEPHVVDDMGNNTSPLGISMNLDGDGYPVIAYRQIALETSMLKVARLYIAFNDGNFGNCGEVPPGYIFLLWRCSVLDNGGQYLEEAQYASVAIKSNGMPLIAYSEFYNVDVGDHATSLKFASQYFQSVLPIVNKP